MYDFLVGFTAGLAFFTVLEILLTDTQTLTTKITSDSEGCLYLVWDSKNVLLPITNVDGYHLGCKPLEEDENQDLRYIPL